MKFKDFFQSKQLKTMVYIVGISVAILIIFQAGMFVGYRRAAFSFSWGDNYYRTFEARPDMMGLVGGRDFPNSHGAIGKIIKIDLPALMIEDQGGIEKNILINSDTVIRRFRDTLKPADLKIDDSVTVIGSPNDKGQIEAKIIRMLPPPPGSMMFPASTSQK